MTTREIKGNSGGGDQDPVTKMKRDDNLGNNGPCHWPPTLVSPTTKDGDDNQLLEENLFSSGYSLGSNGNHHRRMVDYSAQMIVPLHMNVIFNDVGNGNDNVDED